MIAAGFAHMTVRLVQSEAGGANSFTIDNGYNENFKHEFEDGLSIVMVDAGFVFSNIFEPGRVTHNLIFQRFSRLVGTASDEFESPSVSQVLRHEGSIALIIPHVIINSSWQLEPAGEPNGGSSESETS